MADASDRSHLQVFITFPSREHAEKTGENLVSQGLAACAQVIGPIKSIYLWDGNLEKSEEWLCLMKTSEAHFPILEDAVRKVHPYDVPEVVAVPLKACSESYARWMDQVLK